MNCQHILERYAFFFRRYPVTSFDRWVDTALKPWVVMLYVIGLVISFVYIDRWIAYYFHDHPVNALWPILYRLTDLGLGAVYLIPLFLLALFFRYVSPQRLWERRAWFLWGSVLVPSLICLVLKILLGRARPELLFSEHLYGFYGFHRHASFWSFPSGHTTAVMGFVFGVSALFPRYAYAVLIYGLLVALSRVLLTQHFVSDVMIASGLALVEVGLMYRWIQSLDKRAGRQALGCDVG